MDRFDLSYDPIAWYALLGEPEPEDDEIGETRDENRQPYDERKEDEVDRVSLFCLTSNYYYANQYPEEDIFILRATNSIAEDIEALKLQLEESNIYEFFLEKEVDANDKSLPELLRQLNGHVYKFSILSLLNDNEKFVQFNFLDIMEVQLEIVRSFDQLMLMTKLVYENWTNDTYNFEVLNIAMPMTSDFDKDIYQEFKKIIGTCSRVDDIKHYWKWQYLFEGGIPSIEVYVEEEEGKRRELHVKFDCHQFIKDY